MATYSSWTVSGASIDYVPIENPVNETVKLFNGKEQGSVPPTTNLSSNTGQYILAQDGTWIPQPSFTSGGSDAFEILRPSVFTPTYSAYTPTVTNSANAYDVDTNHATTFGEWECAFVSRNLPITDTLLFTSFGSKTQTWTSATINISRAYGYFNDGESNSSSKVTSVKVEFSTNGGSSWTTIVTDLSTAVPLTATTSSYTFTTTPTMGNVQVKLTLVRGGGGMIYDPEIGISVPGSTGDIDLRLYDIWISGTYSGGSGNITCNNLTVTGDATFQNKIYDSTASAGTTGQVLKVLSNGKVGWQTDTVGTGTVTSITTTGANGITISGGSTQTITTSGTFALALGNITPTSISTGTGSFSGDVEFAASIKSPNGSNSPIVISPDGTGDLHVNADSLRLGDNNADATIATNGTGDLILTTHENSTVEGVIRLYDGANGNITLTPHGTGQVQVGSDQVVTLTASQTLTNKTLSSNSVWNGNVIGSAYGGAGTVNGILKANGSGTVSAASAGTDYVTSVSVTSPVSNTGTSANPTIALGSGYGDTQNPYASKTANYFLAAPNGSAGVPTFRAIVAADIPTLNQNTTGNAATASALQTARNINGVSFNGTADITVTAAAGTLTGTTLASGVTASSLTSVGTLTGLTVNGTSKVVGGSSLYFNLDSGSTSHGQLFDDGNFHIHSINSSPMWINSPNGYGVYINNQATGNVILASSGNVGVGTASPSTKLHVSNAGVSAQATFVGTTGSPYITVVGNSGTTILGNESNGGWVGTVGSQSFVFKTTDIERMRIDSSGNVGIGTSSPSQKLDVTGNALVGPSSGKLFIGDVGHGTTYPAIAHQDYATTTGYCLLAPNNGYVFINKRDVASTYIGFRKNNTDMMVLDNSGNLGIATTSPSEKLTVTGKIKASDVLLGNNGSKGYGAITTTSSTSTPTGGASGDHYYIY